jgi:hypothetical protein
MIMSENILCSKVSKTPRSALLRTDFKDAVEILAIETTQQHE